MNAHTKAHLALFSVALIYGANFSIAKEVMPTYIQPLGFILMRVVSGVVLFWLFHTFFIKEKIDKKDIKQLVLCGLFGVAINQMCFFKGLNWTTPINASLIMTTSPMLVLIISSFALKERITSKKILGILLGCMGAVLLIVYGQSIKFNPKGILGDLFIFINAASYSIYLVLVKKLIKKYHPITVIKWVFTFGLLFVFPFGIQEFLIIEWQTFPLNIWLAVVYVLFFVTFMTYFLNGYALKTVNPSVASTYIYLQPLLATIIALLLAKDELSLEKVIAGLLIFIGVFLVSHSPQR